jgi:hypothetical protein
VHSPLASEQSTHLLIAHSYSYEADGYTSGARGATIFLALLVKPNPMPQAKQPPAHSPPPGGGGAPPPLPRGALVGSAGGAGGAAPPRARAARWGHTRPHSRGDELLCRAPLSNRPAARVAFPGLAK